MAPAAETTTDVRTCRVCGCTDQDCTRCIQISGLPCWWVGENDRGPICSLCAEMAAVAVRVSANWGGQVDPELAVQRARARAKIPARAGR